MVAGGFPARATSLYTTEFDNPPFAPSPGFWAGVDGWLSTDPGNGSVAITSDGGAGYLGIVPPAGSFSQVWRNFGLEILDLDLPIVRIRTRIAVVDSTNGRFDFFSLSVFNDRGQLLASLLLDNGPTQFLFDGGSGPERLPATFETKRSCR